MNNNAKINKTFTVTGNTQCTNNEGNLVNVWCLTMQELKTSKLGTQKVADGITLQYFSRTLPDFKLGENVDFDVVVDNTLSNEDCESSQVKVDGYLCKPKPFITDKGVEVFTYRLLEI